MKGKYSVLASIVMAMLVASMDSTIVNTTMPVIAEELGGIELYAWTFASYMILSTVLAPVAGRLSDLFGRKKVFAAGIVLFLLGSMLCGSADTMLMLVLFRAVQGIGAGIMNPFPIIIAGDLFPVEKRGSIQAMFTAMWGLSAVIAPLLGSVFVEFSSWRWVFYVNLPICILSLLLLLPYQEQYEPKRAKIDYGGAIIFTAAIGLLLLPTVVESGRYLYLAGGILLLVLFYWHEKRQASPLIPFTLFRNKQVAWMNVNSLLTYGALFGASSYLPMFLQHQGYSLFLSGVAMLGMSFGWMACSVPAGKWIGRYGYRKLILAGNAILVVSGLWFMLLSASTGFWFVFLGSILFGLAFGMLSTVSVIGSQQLVGPTEKGISASLQMFSRNIGTAVGVTIMGSMLSGATDLLVGYRHMFIYGLIFSMLALLCAIFVSGRIAKSVITEV
ncbi:MFS transporter [Paenibacillus sp. MMS18-CY102]|uniref:MFS transporter n=1 Tax=Paenibacillus sp. MMS18-CY102 TaxID=2682849 RepID=UPI001365DFC0|nr:MFS transporter [Paenibacillus sp. MMS18-CY102]MWC29030.1 MFS transporter [Paenibacillus sp. MMS18-CY102]